jgi:hypothetical protein
VKAVVSARPGVAPALDDKQQPASSDIPEHSPRLGRSPLRRFRVVTDRPHAHLQLLCLGAAVEHCEQMALRRS